MRLRGGGGVLGCEIPSMVGVRIFSGTTHYTFLIKSLNFVWISMCVIECDLESIVQNSTFPNPES